ncbi:hypothetical protein FVE67_01330 [Thermosulfurimonas marina]|uniref:Uncharacterized protein n=1 Tax=Thermosulfurimonas marina TaxID=2047767 RepID=A0A6H1WQM6_9BACT|nr:hypothetical protein [Thermosulfurimonas marina]QJA05517.1 hypothetical protein FVE67_01330 [Thermosulfurimonas marina]
MPDRVEKPSHIRPLLPPAEFEERPPRERDSGRRPPSKPKKEGPEERPPENGKGQVVDVTV